MTTWTVCPSMISGLVSNGPGLPRGGPGICGLPSGPANVRKNTGTWSIMWMSPSVTVRTNRRGAALATGATRISAAVPTAPAPTFMKLRRVEPFVGASTISVESGTSNVVGAELVCSAASQASGAVTNSESARSRANSSGSARDAAGASASARVSARAVAVAAASATRAPSSARCCHGSAARRASGTSRVVPASATTMATSQPPVPGDGATSVARTTVSHAAAPAMRLRVGSRLRGAGVIFTRSPSVLMRGGVELHEALLAAQLDQRRGPGGGVAVLQPRQPCRRRDGEPQEDRAGGEGTDEADPARPADLVGAGRADQPEGPAVEDQRLVLEVVEHQPHLHGRHAVRDAEVHGPRGADELLDGVDRERAEGGVDAAAEPGAGGVADGAVQRYRGRR